jgi:hypothetical protein
MVMVFTDRDRFETVRSIRDNGKLLFSMTVVADAVIDASSGGAGGSQRAAT